MVIYHPKVMPCNLQEIPQEFRKMCMRLCQDEPIPRYESHEELFAYIIADLDSRERQVVKAYFDSLFALNLTDREFLSVWRTAGADLLMNGEEEGDVKEYFFVPLSKALESPQK